MDGKPLSDRMSHDMNYEVIPFLCPDGGLNFVQSRYRELAYLGRIHILGHWLTLME